MKLSQKEREILKEKIEILSEMIDLIFERQDAHSITQAHILDKRIESIANYIEDNLEFEEISDEKEISTETLIQKLMHGEGSLSLDEVQFMANQLNKCEYYFVVNRLKELEGCVLSEENIFKIKEMEPVVYKIVKEWFLSKLSINLNYV
jgi:predicted DNA-binding protein YlxM (UPF0122 family)